MKSKSKRSIIQTITIVGLLSCACLVAAVTSTIIHNSPKNSAVTSITANAQDSSIVKQWANGQAGDDLTVTLYNDGKLVVDGNGAMNNWESFDQVPWIANYSNNIKSVVIGSQVTSIGKYAFSQCPYLKSVLLPKNLEGVQEYAFWESENLTTIYFEGENITAWRLVKLVISGTGNSALENATICYYKVEEPTTSGNYWRYVNGEPTVWQAHVEHESSDWIIDQKASCTSEGSRYKKCTECGKELQRETIKKTQHDYKTTTTLPTCTAQGYTTYTCNDCGHIETGDYVATKSHTTGDWIIETQATCTQTGLKYKICSVCRNRVNEETIQNAHNFRTEIISPTCSAEGYTNHICKLCGYNYQDETINKVSHTFGINGKADTCSKCQAVNPSIISNKKEALVALVPGYKTQEMSEVLDYCYGLLDEGGGNLTQLQSTQAFAESLVNAQIKVETAARVSIVTTASDGGTLLNVKVKSVAKASLVMQLPSGKDVKSKTLTLELSRAKLGDGAATSLRNAIFAQYGMISENSIAEIFSLNWGYSIGSSATEMINNAGIKLTDTVEIEFPIQKELYEGSTVKLAVMQGGVLSILETEMIKTANGWNVKVCLDRFGSVALIYDVKVHNHNMVKITGKAATSEESGWKDYYYCNDCGQNFSDSAGKNLISNIEDWKENGGRLPIKTSPLTFLRVLSDLLASIAKILQAILSVFTQFHK